jgi:RNA polymerase sigma factor (sigma-70 family)
MAFSKKGKEEAAKAALSSAPEALSELEASQLFTEDPLEALLDEQSDEDFGDLELKERSGKPVKLAEWSAQDFSSIYLRFRPHLERHARRFLNNPSQVDEVVQDAFLYLMVSLPELDSEIGVLRFLKWKTRLLALDVIRASGRAYINSIDDVQEPESNDPEVYSHLEQQDDAAVVRLALSKLNPRHREVLIASMYEEKSTEEIASQVGLSENATRQLIFRARAAFKKALIGDVDTTGMSAAAILSVAARKAASEGKKVGAAALTLIALVVMSLLFSQDSTELPLTRWQKLLQALDQAKNQVKQTPRLVLLPLIQCRRLEPQMLLLKQRIRRIRLLFLRAHQLLQSRNKSRLRQFLALQLPGLFSTRIPSPGSLPLISPTQLSGTMA